MPHFRCPAFRVAGGCLLAALVGAVDARAQIDDGELIILPPFEVNGTPQWNHAAIPGYEVLSLASPAETRAILEELVNAMRFAPLFFAPERSLEVSETATLFLRHHASAATLAEIREQKKLSFTVRSYTASRGDTAVSFPSAETIEGWRTRRRSPLTEHFIWLCNLCAPTLPTWYREGLPPLLVSVRATRDTLERGRMSWQNSPLLPIEELLAVTTAAHLDALNSGSRERRDAFYAGAALFVHWGIFAENGRRRSAFLHFVEAAARQPVDDAMFRRSFGIGLAEAPAVLAAHIPVAARTGNRLTLPRASAARARARINVLPATQGQVARLVGRSYAILGDITFPAQRMSYLARARTVFETVMVDGTVDPGVAGELGLLEFSEGNFAAAVRHLETAVAAHSRSARVFIALAFARLRAAGWQPNDGQPIEDPLFREVMALMSAAETLRPPLPDLARIPADLHLRRDALVPAAELERLAANARVFSRVSGLVLAVARLAHKTGDTPLALELIENSLRWPNLNPPDRESLERLRVELAATAPAN